MISKFTSVSFITIFVLLLASCGTDRDSNHSQTKIVQDLYPHSTAACVAQYSNGQTYFSHIAVNPKVSCTEIDVTLGNCNFSGLWEEAVAVAEGECKASIKNKNKKNTCKFTWGKCARLGNIPQ